MRLHKENWPDCKQSEVIHIVDELKKFDAEIFVHDPIADRNIVKKLYGIDLIPWKKIPKLDAIIFSVGHSYYCNLKPEDILKKLKGPKYIVDIKSILNPLDFKGKKLNFWQI